MGQNSPMNPNQQQQQQQQLINMNMMGNQQQGNQGPMQQQASNSSQVTQQNQAITTQAQVKIFVIKHGFLWDFHFVFYFVVEWSKSSR